MKAKKYLLMSLSFAATLAMFGGARDAHAQACGNGSVQPNSPQLEQCDDGDNDNDDGCSSTCTIEPGWDCVDEPSVCTLIVCGNGITQAGEECDGGGCCNTDCTLKDNGSSCRAAAGACDAAETCNGVSADCPVDAKLTTQCRASAGACDLAETCDGVANNCPADAKSSGECRAAAGVCDVAESCDGVSNTCPADAFVSSATVCRAAGGVCDIAENCTGSTAACPADAKSTSECRAANGVCDLAETCNGSGNDCPVDAKASSETVCRPAVNPECDAAENCTGVTDNCPDDVLIGCGDGDGVDCTVSACTVDGCVEEETCVEICRGPGFWQNHSGYEKDGENIGQAVIDAVGSLSICGVSIDATTSLGSLNSALEGLCMRAQGVKQRQLYRQLVTAALNCSISEGGTCDQITNRFTDIGFDDCSDLCAGAELPDGPTVKECTDALACFNAGGRIIEGECAKGTCDGDGETYCGNDEDCGDEIECVRFEDSCRGVDLCSEDLEAPAQICPTSGPASSPKLCQEARHNSCTIDSCY